MSGERYIPDSQTRLGLHLRQFEAGLVTAEEMVTDLLATLRHFAESHGVDYGACDDRGHMHYLAECRDGYREGWLS